MRKWITYYLKNSNFFSEIYFLVGSLLVNILKLFVKPDPKVALFVSYGGKQFSDSPYALYQAMKKDQRFSDWQLVWAFTAPDKFGEVDNKVKIDSLAYFKTCLKARVWITNSGIKRYLDFNGKHTFFINTWHGIPLKKIGRDEKGVRKSKVFARKWFEFRDADMNLYHSDYDLKVLKHVFSAPEKHFYQFGLPRNDLLYRLKDDQSFKKEIRSRLHIPEGKKVILYAPTVRGEQVSQSKDNVFVNPFHFNLWKQKFSDTVILFRAHYFVTEKENTQFSNVIDVTNYPNIDDLYLVADLLISDYSSVFFDYSITDKPMFCYAYDLEQYQQYQGLYVDLKQTLPHFATNETQLIKQIQQYGQLKTDNATINFKYKFLDHLNGGASQAVLDEVAKQINVGSQY